MRSNLHGRELCFHYLFRTVSIFTNFPRLFRAFNDRQYTGAAVLHKCVIMNYEASIQGLQEGGGGKTSDLYVML